jgi:metal-sulfur cluster biosynthetic enzyme
MMTEQEVRSALNGVIDPCSVAAGCSAGLDDMGLVRMVELRETPAGLRVEVVIAVTEYGCLMGAPFASEAYKALCGLPGIAHVEVKLDDRFDWVPEDMSEPYRARLHHHRSWRNGVIPIRPLSANGTVNAECGNREAVS